MRCQRSDCRGGRERGRRIVEGEKEDSEREERKKEGEGGHTAPLDYRHRRGRRFVDHIECPAFTELLPELRNL